MHLDAGGTVSESLLSWNLLRFVFLFGFSTQSGTARTDAIVMGEGKKKKNTPGSWSTTPALRYAVAVKLIERTARAHHQRHPFMFRACGRARSANQLRMAWIGLESQDLLPVDKAHMTPHMQLTRRDILIPSLQVRARPCLARVVQTEIIVRPVRRLSIRPEC